MSKLFKMFSEEIDNLNWEDISSIRNNLEGMWRQIYSDKYSLKYELRKLFEDYSIDISERSVETTTHYKWHIYSDPKRRYKVWLHEYKDRENRKGGYAEIPHNHRYWFTSLLITGSFLHQEYEVERDVTRTDYFRTIKIISINRFLSGHIYTISPDVIHSLSDFSERTWTILIQSQPYKEYSESFRLESKEIKKHYPFSTRLSTFLDEIDNLEF